MIKLISFLVLVITATAMAVVLPGTPRDTITLAWDYSSNDADVFKLYSSTNIAIPLTNWTLAATTSGTNRFVTVSNIVARQQWFYVTASNWWGETYPSNIAGTVQMLGAVLNTRILP